jgi:hypothetical protein
MTTPVPNIKKAIMDMLKGYEVINYGTDSTDSGLS